MSELNPTTEGPWPFLVHLNILYDQMQETPTRVLLFPVDRDTHEFFGRL